MRKVRAVRDSARNLSGIYVYAGPFFGRLDVTPAADGKYHGWLRMTDGLLLGSWQYADLRFGYYDLDGRARQLAWAQGHRPHKTGAQPVNQQRRAYPAIAAGHSHPEAFCLMKYQTDDGLLTEWLWNSRDGVTPFVIMSPDGLREMKHIDWQRDQFAPGHKPQPGQRIFATRTRERAAQLAKDLVERHWDENDSNVYPMSRSYASKEEATAAMVADFWQDGHAPCIVTVQADGTWEGQQPQEGGASAKG